MKTIIIATLGFISAAQLSIADVTDKLIGGTWKGTVTQTADGESIRIQGSTVYTRYQKTGLESVTTAKANGVTLVSTTRFRKDGKVEGVMKWKDKVVSVSSGTWSATGKVLTSHLKTEEMGDTLVSVSKTTLTSPNRITISEKATTGERAAGTMTRK
jgi:hypothetical protein